MPWRPQSASATHPRMHSVWGALLALLPRPHAQAESHGRGGGADAAAGGAPTAATSAAAVALWEEICEHSLFGGSHERKCVRSAVSHLTRPFSSLSRTQRCRRATDGRTACRTPNQMIDQVPRIRAVQPPGAPLLRGDAPRSVFQHVHALPRQQPQQGGQPSAQHSATLPAEGALRAASAQRSIDHSSPSHEALCPRTL